MPDISEVISKLSGIEGISKEDIETVNAIVEEAKSEKAKAGRILEEKKQVQVKVEQAEEKYDI